MCAMATVGKKRDGGKVVLVGTFRPQNAEWIKSRRLYNLPLPTPLAHSVGSRVPRDRVGRAGALRTPLVGSRVPRDRALPFHRSISRIVLIAEGLPSAAYAAKFREVVDGAWLKAEGYKVAAKGEEHGEAYALYELGEKMSVAAVLSDPRADVYVASSRCPSVKIDAAFYDRPYPRIGGKSMPLIFDKLKPYFKKWHSATTFNPVQMDFMQPMFPKRSFPAMPPLEYTKGAIRKIPVSRHARQFRMGEFFCGPGGLACGALSAKIEVPDFAITHAWANDYDRDTCNTYAENVCCDHPETVICHDVRTLDIDDPHLTPIDGFAFGFPCNDFSVVGEHKGFDGMYGPLYQYGVAILRKFQPLWFFAENVGGLASANEGAAFKKILESMKGAGYRVYPHLYKFEDYGVPQTRHRIIIIGIRNDQPFVFYPPCPSALAPRDNSARAALEEPPIPSDAPNNTLTAQNAKVEYRCAA